ncbi:sigma-70 family RNA polymerase sigma factor [Nocardioides okcheonensis]|uniref:sigma-70 family RNA polymerase sigma factor n=1 Tax=Nocardioides okcheonensis TaxID=2894081 RepID=UPI001E4DE66C|nr:sigma-70 family RNA polymerase sigma factor [Nocardioides okcheonensis]UFN44595.1 sigma-70 family RNA polymerase sigma factor [Nocardioides okcheonensis]
MDSRTSTPARPPARSDGGRERTTERLLARLHDPSLHLDDGERKDLADAVVVANLPVARSIAGRFARRGCPLEDLEQAASLALVRAVQRYDPGAGHHFMSYAVPCITGEVKRHFRDRGWMVRPPRPVQELQPLVERELLRHDPDTGRSPGHAEVAARLGVPVAGVRQALLARGCFSPASLDKPVAGHDDVLVRDTLVSPHAERDYLAAEARAVLEPVLDILDEPERRLLQMRFVDELTQTEIGAALGMSQSHVSRQVNALLKRLRHALEHQSRAA